MEIIQLLMFLVAFVIWKVKGYSPKYICIFMVPFQSMPLLYLPLVTSYLIAVQLCFLLTVLMRPNEILNSLRSDIFVVCCIIFAPFIISYIWNLFYFVPVYTFETEMHLRGRLRTSLNQTNITQLAYVIFALVLFWLFSSLKLELNKVRKVLDISIYIIVGVGLLQFISWYGGFYKIYQIFFYTLDLGMHGQRLGAWKRINSTFVEPSYFGFWSSFTLFFYLTCFGLKDFVRSRAVQALFICGLMSTTTTFYVGAAFLVAIMYLFYSDAREKVLIYSIGAFVLPFVVYFLTDDIASYIESKQGSTRLRTVYGITVAWEAFWTSPVFGKAYGTTKAFFIHTQMLVSVGIVGVIIILVGLGIVMVKYKNVFIYVVCVILLGFGNFELTRPEMWVYLGLLSNQYIKIQVDALQEKRERQNV